MCTKVVIKHQSSSSYSRHYSVPLIPELPGLADFEGMIMHSHNYRIPEVFKDKVVAILGAGSSGQDMALDIAPFAKHVSLLY